MPTFLWAKATWLISVIATVLCWNRQPSSLTVYTKPPLTLLTTIHGPVKFSWTNFGCRSSFTNLLTPSSINTTYPTIALAPGDVRLTRAMCACRSLADFLSVRVLHHPLMFRHRPFRSLTEGRFVEVYGADESARLSPEERFGWHHSPRDGRVWCRSIGPRRCRKIHTPPVEWATPCSESISCSRPLSSRMVGRSEVQRCLEPPQQTPIHFNREIPAGVTSSLSSLFLCMYCVFCRQRLREETLVRLVREVQTHWLPLCRIISTC